MIGEVPSALFDRYIALLNASQAARAIFRANKRSAFGLETERGPRIVMGHDAGVAFQRLTDGAALYACEEGNPAWSNAELISARCRGSIPVLSGPRTSLRNQPRRSHLVTEHEA
jgi:hypothetical protein